MLCGDRARDIGEGAKQGIYMYVVGAATWGPVGVAGCRADGTGAGTTLPLPLTATLPPPMDF